MKNLFLIIFCFLLISCSKNQNAENIRNTVEIAIKKSSQKTNDIIREFNTNKVNGIDNTKLLSKMYFEAVEVNSSCSDLITKLEDINSIVNLKKEALNYFNFSNSFLTDFIKPMAVMPYAELQGNEEVQKQMSASLLKSVKVSQQMSNKILEFCKEHNLKMKISEYDETEFDSEIEELKTN